MSNKLIVKDNIYGNIVIEGIYKELIETEEFQRLKDIIQTGTSAYEYEEMEKETRFDHSIGSYHLMCRIVNNIEKQLSPYGFNISKKEKEIAKIAMLLHDIGHGAFSHTLENVTGCSHEQITIDIVKDKELEINNIITKYYGEEFANEVVEFLESIYEQNKENKREKGIKIEGNQISIKNLLASLISNNIDADRLDYLIRDSKSAGFKDLTEVYKLIDSFKCVFDLDKMIVAIPDEKLYLAETCFFERVRNYDKIYYCALSVIGDYVFEILLKELRNNPDQVPNDIDTVIRNFLTKENVKFTTKEYLKIIETPVNKAIEYIRETTDDEKIKYLCNIKQVTKDFRLLDTDKKESYIKKILGKAFKELDSNTNCLRDETREIKSYKISDIECTNVITNEGIQKYQDLDQHTINLKPYKNRVVGINPEILRLELGISKEDFENRGCKIIEEVINTVTKPKDEFKFEYVVNGNVGVEYRNIKSKIEKCGYPIISEKEYCSYDEYYDNINEYQFLKNREILRIRQEQVFSEDKEIVEFKKMRITYKKCRDNGDSIYTTRRKNEEIGDSTNLEEYQNFLDDMKINKEDLTPILNVDNMRRQITIKMNGSLIDILFNTALYTNAIYKTKGQVGKITIKLRDNKIFDRVALLEVREFIEKEFPALIPHISNSNIYEIGIVDTYDKYKKGFNQDKEIENYEMENKDSINKLDEIVEKLKHKKEFKYLDKMYSSIENETEDIII